jgi:exopolysaccharide biosynthesis WecB/TagA/CpsF family protein
MRAASLPHHVIARGIDLLGAALVVAVLSPFMVVRAFASWATLGRVFDRDVAYGLHGRPMALLSFSGPLPAATVARWLNVLSGSLSLGGPSPMGPKQVERARNEAPARLAVRPGLVTVRVVRSALGLAYHGDEEADLEFVRGFHCLSGIGLATRGLIVKVLGGGQQRLTVRRMRMMGVKLDNTSINEAVSWLIERALASMPTTALFANVDCINIASRNLTYRRALTSADRVFADGIGIRIAARVFGQQIVDNVNGTDMFPLLCEAAARSGTSLYLLGGLPGVAEGAARAATQITPGLKIAGTNHGFFTRDEEASVIAQINDSGASILLVGFGAPKQELWIEKNANQLAAPVRLGVGGLFDYYAGRIPRAPAWMREIGMEWIWRLAQEPSRMWRRYVLGNVTFLYRVGRRYLQGGHGPTAAAIRTSSSVSHRLAAARLWLLQLKLPVLRQASRASKRLVDISGSLLLLILLSPLFLATALAIKLESRGSVIYRQKRVGRDGREFMMLKFRSMFVDAEQRLQSLLEHNEMDGGVIFKMREDPRVTRVGKFIRRTSIDELPQLFNVLRGDMSLVGPRPPLPREVELYSFHDRSRLGAVPGITCIWQVSGRSEIPFDRQVEMDLDYIHRQSMAEDLKLLFRTVPALLFGRGAY